MDEEALARPLAARRERGRYFTPAPLAQFVVERAAALCPARPTVVDPACGAGAFLDAAARRWRSAPLLGLELSPEAAAECRRRVPRATVRQGDALRGGLDALLARAPRGAFELWVGNPPYNGTSPALADRALYERLRALWPATLPKGTSLRDDFAFFLLLAHHRLSTRRGALAFITSATLLDAFLYAPLRERLLGTLDLREVIELGPGAFQDTRVRTCVTLWTSPRRGLKAAYRTREAGGPFQRGQLGRAVRWTPGANAWLLRPPSGPAARLDDAWRSRGEPLSTLVPVSFPGLKTRFDELLVDDDAPRLLERVRAFLAAARTGKGLDAFSRAWGIPARCWPKLEALAAEARRQRVDVDRRRVRRFFRYAGARHRGTLPASAQAFCYLDRRLIPRGDHRLHGAYDPHACATKLVFNVRERPLSAAVVKLSGCVHAHRHARFAPLWVPERLWRDGLAAARRGALGADVVNLSVRGRAWAQSLGGPEAAFLAICDFVNSPAVQEVWAPSLAASHELCVPFDALP